MEVGDEEACDSDGHNEKSQEAVLNKRRRVVIITNGAEAFNL